MKLPFPASRLRNSIEHLGPEALFLVLACSFGLGVLLANGPFQAPDENDHYARVFQLSEGTLIGERRGGAAGGELPKAAIDVTDTEGMPFHNERKMSRSLFVRLLHPAFVDWSKAPRVYESFPHTVVYGPAGYLPQTVAVFLGYAALRTLPIYRWTILVLLVCPMSLYLFGSIAPDGMLITGAAQLLALLVRLAMRRDVRVGPREQAVILVLAGLLSAAKPAYLPMAAVAWLLVIPRLGSLRGRMIFSAATVACCLLPVLL
jgi:hypothetical protein